MQNQTENCQPRGGKLAPRGRVRSGQKPRRIQRARASTAEVGPSRDVVQYRQARFIINAQAALESVYLIAAARIWACGPIAIAGASTALGGIAAPAAPCHANAGESPPWPRLPQARSCAIPAIPRGPSAQGRRPSRHAGLPGQRHIGTGWSCICADRAFSQGKCALHGAGLALELARSGSTAF